ncbi:MAG: substrate-binding domain-containing protein [Oscillospiraceae bacterium]|jgi:ABC-type sugar transport system substrate-binding protein
MKKLLTTIVALSMALGLMTACGKDSESSTVSQTTADTAGSQPSSSQTGETTVKPFKLGFSVWGTSDNHGRYVTQAAEWCEALGGEVIVDSGALTPEAQIASIENLIQSGCDIVTFCAYTGESIIPKISQLCKENEVYFAIWDTTITDADILEMVNANPYFCGTTNEDQFEAGYQEVSILADKGAENFMFIKYAVGVATCDEREKGALKAIEDLGLTNVYTIVAPEDVKKAVQDVLTNYPEVDGIISLGAAATYITPAIQAIDAVGRKGEVMTAAFDFSDTMGGENEAGDLSLVFGGHVVTTHFANIMCISAFSGNPINADKEQLTIPYLTITSQADIDDYNKYIIGETPPYTAEEMLDSISGKTFEEFQQIVSEYSIQTIAEKMQ